MADVADVSGLELRSKITSGGELGLSPDVIAAYSKRATGEKYLITPNKSVA